MPDVTEPTIMFADRSDNGVVISFADGTNAFYSAELLMQMLPQAREIGATEPGEN